MGCMRSPPHLRVLVTVCHHIEAFRAEISEAEVRCLEEADEEFIRTAEVLVVFRNREMLSVLPEMGNLRLVQALTAGVDHLDLSAVPEGVAVQSNAGANAWAVAEHAMSLIFASIKKVVWRHMEMMRGRFPQMVESALLRGKTVGIVGYGHIGRCLAKMLAPFGVNLLAINRRGKGDGLVRDVWKPERLDELLTRSDIVVLSLPLTPETEGLIDGRRLRLMKDDAVLVNVSRGKIIVERDLYEHLRDHPRFTAALDVWWHYGDAFRQKYPFETLPNVVMTPHCAGVYEGEWEDMMRHAARRVKSFFQDAGGGPSPPPPGARPVGEGVTGLRIFHTILHIVR